MKSCIQCSGLMALEDRGELLEAVDVGTLFGYRCLKCGHVEPWRDEVPQLAGQDTTRVQQVIHYVH